MSSTQTSQVAALIDGLATGAVEIVDLTQPLTETTPVIKLPPPFANTPGLSREEISRYDDRGPAWAWYTLTIGEHVGTHLDAPIHWVTGKDGKDVGSIEASTLVGPACVVDKTAETEQDNGYLLTVAGPRELGVRERPRPRRRLGAAQDRLAVARARRDAVPQRGRERAA